MRDISSINHPRGERSYDLTCCRVDLSFFLKKRKERQTLNFHVAGNDCWLLLVTIYSVARQNDKTKGTTGFNRVVNMFTDVVRAQTYLWHSCRRLNDTETQRYAFSSIYANVGINGLMVEKLNGKIYNRPCYIRLWLLLSISKTLNYHWKSTRLSGNELNVFPREVSKNVRPRIRRRFHTSLYTSVSSAI